MYEAAYLIWALCCERIIRKNGDDDTQEDKESRRHGPDTVHNRLVKALNLRLEMDRLSVRRKFGLRATRPELVLLRPTSFCDSSASCRLSPRIFLFHLATRLHPRRSWTPHTRWWHGEYDPDPLRSVLRRSLGRVFMLWPSSACGNDGRHE